MTLISVSHLKMAADTLFGFERRSWAVWPWVCLRPCPAPNRETVGLQGARNAREPATNPCSPTGASGSHPRCLGSHAKVGKAGANRKCGPEAGTIGQPNHPDMCTRFPLSKNRARFPHYRDRRGTDRNSHLALGANRKSGTAPRRAGNHAHQADRRSRFLALIWAMRMGPSENSPSPAFRVNSRK